MAPPQPSGPLSSNLEALSYINGMVEAFKAFDSNSDGLISREELTGIMGSLGYKDTGEQEMKDMMRRGDRNGDGLLSMAEFLEIMNAKELDVGDLAGLLQAATSVLGVDGNDDDDALVTGEELYEVLSCMGRLSMEDCMDVIASMDGDGDGAVSLEDLKLIIHSLV